MHPKVISFHYTLTDPTGETLDSSLGGQPLTYMEGVGQIIPGLESAMQGLEVGTKKCIRVSSEQAYGPHDKAGLFDVPRDRLPKQDIQVGDQFQVANDSNSPPLRVAQITDTHVTLDANHPLAGVDLTFDVEVTQVREATPEEVEHGHAHGEGGHHH